jgi:hypothetical protein
MHATSLFTVGVIIGDAVLPVIIGVLMDSHGSYSLPVVIFIAVVLMIVIYIFMHYYMMRRGKHVRKLIPISEDEYNTHEKTLPVVMVPTELACLDHEENVLSQP